LGPNFGVHLYSSSVVGLVKLAENYYAHAWLNDDIINDKSQIKNVDTNAYYSDHIFQNVENPYEDGWD
jgi:hypothetical protein